jgi:epoxide hydrolase-like predicted phosphatase
MTQKPAIIFDLGGVVVNLDVSRTLQSFQEKIPGFSSERFNGSPDQLRLYSRYETGATTSEQFYQEFLTHYQTDIPFQSFRESWNEMILDLPPERMDLLNTLRDDGRKIYLLSNINPLHAEEMQRVFQCLDLPGTFKGHFDRVYYSYEMGLRKPDPAIFTRVLVENDLTAENTLFIDDSLQHVESAKRLGLQTIHLLKPRSIDTLSL